MKKYEKPRLMALSLSGNDMLCGGCTPGSLSDLDSDMLKFIKEQWDGLFTSGESCPIQGFPELEGYCKFTLDNKLFAS